MSQLNEKFENSGWEEYVAHEGDAEFGEFRF